MFTMHAKKLMALFAVLFLATFSVQAQDAKVKGSMDALKTQLNKLGAPKTEGENLFFGAAKINGDFSVVDAVKASHGGTATIFVKKGGNYVRISTNVMKEGARAVGTPLDPTGPAKAAIDQGKAYYGIVDILGKMYNTGYEPIKTAKGETIGVYYVGYLME